MSTGDLPKVDRRTTLKWLAAGVMSTVSAHRAAARAMESALDVDSGASLGVARPVTGTGYGPDPDLTDPVLPWEKTMTDAQLRIAASLCDMILPADDASPSASQVGVPAFIDEWVSAPYPDQQRDRETVLEGLQWLESTCSSRFGARFAEAKDAERRSLLDSIAFEENVEPGLEQQRDFFTLYRNLTMSAFYATQEGMADIGYIGNTPIAGEYPGPTPEALAHLEKALNSLGLEMPET